MRSITVSLEDEQYADVERLSEEKDEYSSKSDVVRKLLHRAFKHNNLANKLEAKEDRIEELEQRNENLNKRLADENELRRENERLRNEKRTLIEQREEHQELTEYVEEERSLQQRREERQREKEAAPIWKRIEWFVFGRR